MKITINVSTDSTETHIEATDPSLVISQLEKAIAALHAEIDEYKNCPYHDFPYPASPEYLAQKRYEHITANDPMIHCSRFPTWDELPSVIKVAYYE